MDGTWMLVIIEGFVLAMAVFALWRKSTSDFSRLQTIVEATTSRVSTLEEVQSRMKETITGLDKQIGIVSTKLSHLESMGSDFRNNQDRLFKRIGRVDRNLIALVNFLQGQEGQNLKDLNLAEDPSE